LIFLLKKQDPQQSLNLLEDRNMPRLMQMMAICLLCYLVVGCSREKPKESPPDTGEAQKAELRGDIGKAIQLLEQEKFVEFFERYMPAETLAGKPKNLSMPLAVVAIQTQTPEFFPDTLEILRALNQDDIEFLNEEKTEARIGVSHRPVFSSKRTNPLSDPAEESVPVLEGFAGDLPEVLTQAVSTLEAGDYQAFVEKMYPRAELLAVTSDAGMKNLLARLKEHPQMVEQMIADLKALQQLAPEYDEQQTVATFQIEIDKQPSRHFRFEKQGTWRLANTSQAVRTEMHRQAGQQTLSMKDLPGADWEWSLDHWRLVNPRPLEAFEERE
jgi:hypothetical protein